MNSYATENRFIRMIDSRQKMDEWLADIRLETQTGVDLEADSLHHYKDRVCLVQISTQREDAIIDPQAFDVQPGLRSLLENPGILKIFHDADFDLRSLNRDFGICSKNIFDTKISLDLLGRDNVGLASVLNHYYGITLRKKYQRYNWSRRPLDDEAIRYAAMDTRYLIPLKTILTDDLEKAGRMEWAQEEFRNLESIRWHPGKRETLTFWRFVKRHSGHPQYLECLRLLWNVRESEAERKDKPVFQMFPDSVLLELAEHAGHKKNSQSVEILLKHVDASIRHKISAVIESARNTPPDRCPVRPNGLFDNDPPYNTSLFRILKRHRDHAAEKEAIDPGIIAGNKLLKKLAELSEDALRDYTIVRQMTGLRFWQWRLLALSSFHGMSSDG